MALTRYAADARGADTHWTTAWLNLVSLFAIFAVLMASSMGCSTWKNPLKALRGQSPEPEENEEEEAKLVGDLARVVNDRPMMITGYGIVEGLNGTGSPVPESEVRSLLLNQLKKEKHPNPAALLDSRNTAVVAVQAALPPGVRKGDRLDIEIRAIGGTETTSLRNGYLRRTELADNPVLQVGGSMKMFGGKTRGYAEGPVLIDPSADRDEPNRQGSVTAMKRGWVLGGGRSTVDRDLVLALKLDKQYLSNAKRIEKAVNQRFFTYDRGVKSGVAEAHRPNTLGSNSGGIIPISLDIPEVYRTNVPQYVQVVHSIALSKGLEHHSRLELLERQLLDPVTAASASVQLEAIGPEAVPILKKGLGSKNTEVKFYSARALAYMGDSEAPEAAQALAEVAREEWAFRVYALAALSVMDHFIAENALRELLNGSSVETRYGAYRALSTKNEQDGYPDRNIAGEKLGRRYPFHFNVLDTNGPPMIHITRSHRPEIVLFGREQALEGQFQADAGSRIFIQSMRGNQVKVVRLSANPNLPNEPRMVSRRAEEVIRAIAELGGTYTDVLQALQELADQGALGGRLAVDELPEGQRTYDRSLMASDDGQEDEEEEKKKSWVPGWLTAWRNDDDDKETN